MTSSDLTLWEKWVVIPHVKNTWFIEGYETPDYINQKIKGDGYNYPFIILANEKPIGYIQCCDLYAYKQLSKNKRGLFTDEPPGTFCVDLFIADEDYLDKGYGTETIKTFIQFIFQNLFADRIKIDPDINNKRAIRCYEKVGFKKIRVKNDAVTDCQIMEITNDTNSRQISLYKFLKPILIWAYQQTNILSVGLIGSFATGAAHDQSDVDLIFLCKDKKYYLEHTDWLKQFGTPYKEATEEYGAVRSLRVWYQDGFEVEFSFGSESWAAIPIDSGTQRVVKAGMRILIDKNGLLKNLLTELQSTTRKAV